MSEPDEARLAVALALARRAGQEALARRAHARVSWKGPGDRLTDADVGVQSWLLEELGVCFPEDGVIAEEALESRDADREWVWVLDPLDGTNNYALGIPCFAVSIGIFCGGSPWAGVVYDPNTGLACWAGRGLGAFAGERRLRLEPRPLGPASNVSVRVPVDPGLEPVVHEWLRQYKFRGFGSVALHLAYTALGAIDLVLDHTAALWDLGAGAAVLLEAGGRISDPGGRPLFPFDLESYRGGPVPFLAGNPAAHDTALRDRGSLVAAVGWRP